MLPTVPARAARRAAAAATVLATALASVAAGAGRVAVVTVDDDAYLALDRGGLARDDPATPVRLIVVRDGRLVADRPLPRSERLETVRKPNGGLVRVEDAIVDDAWATPDGTAAVVAHRRYRVERPLDARGEPDVDRLTVLESDLAIEWIDPDHPAGRWTERIGAGSVLGSVRLLDSGAAVAVVAGDGEHSDLRVYAAEGGLLALQRDLLGTNPEVREAGDGRTAVFDVAYTSRPGLPDRALLVVGLDAPAAWTYAWTYGAEQEPVAWEVETDGTLVVTTASYVFRYGRDGTPLGSARRR